MAHRPFRDRQRDGRRGAIVSEKPVFHVGDRLPVSLTREQLASIIGISVGRLDVLRAQRSHPAIRELLPRVGHCRFSGVTAQAWLDQQQSSTTRFFGSARKRHSVKP